MGRLSLPVNYSKSENSCRQHDIPSAPVVPIHHNAFSVSQSKSVAAGKQSTWPTLEERSYNPVNHLVLSEPVPLDGPIKRTQNKVPTEKVQVKVQYGTPECPEVLRSNQDYGYYGKDSVGVSKLRLFAHVHE